MVNCLAHADGVARSGGWGAGCRGWEMVEQKSIGEERGGSEGCFVFIGAFDCFSGIQIVAV